jgi:hypothetical protein
MMIKATVDTGIGTRERVEINPRFVVYYFRDNSTGLTQLRLVDGTDASTDLRYSKVIELIANANGMSS